MRPIFSTKDEISSTAKLLEVIRSKSPAEADLSETFVLASPSRGERIRGFLQHLPVFRKRLVVGIEVGSTHVDLVKVLPLSPSRHRLLDYRRIPVEPTMQLGSPPFCEFLRSVVLDFSGSLKRVSLWSSLSSTEGDLRQIRIPAKAAKGKLAQAVYWVARKELRFDEAETFFDFEVQGQVPPEADGKIWVMAYTAPRRAIKERKELFARSGLELAGLTIAPFVLQNLFRSHWVSTSGTLAYAVLQLGQRASRISVFWKENLILTKAIEIGTEQLAPAATSESEDDDRQLSMADPALAKLADEIEALFQYHCGPGKGDPIHKLFLAEPATLGKSLCNHLGQRLGVKIVALDLLNPANPHLSTVRPPQALAERALFTSAMGLALSSNAHTPNLVCPFAQKAQKAAMARLNRSLLWALVIIALSIGGLFIQQDHVRNQKRGELTQLQHEMARFNPVASSERLTAMASKVQVRQQTLKVKAEKYLSLAVLSELSALTPGSIRLLSIMADFGGLPDSAARNLGSAQIKSVSRSLVIEGIIEGDSLSAETALAHYLMRLGASPLFVDPAVHQSALEITQEVGEVLHFFLRMGLGHGG